MSSPTDETLRERLRALAEVPVASIEQLEEKVVERFTGRRRRRRLAASTSAAAVVLAGAGIITLVPTDTSPERRAENATGGPADDTKFESAERSVTSTRSSSSSPPSVSATSISVQRIEIRAGVDGGEDLTFVFDGAVPDERVTFAPDVSEIEAPGIAYAVQDPSGISVCANSHSDLGAGMQSGSVDILIPSDWWTPDAPVHDVPYAWDPPVDSLPDDVDSPGKIIGCGPYNGYVQYSILSPSSDDPEDVRVSVTGEANRLLVRIRP